MKLKFKNHSIVVKINTECSSKTWESVFKSKNRNFSFTYEDEEHNVVSTGVRGDDAIWIPFSSQKGLKIIAENDRYQSLNNSLLTCKRIQKLSSSLFPNIYDCFLSEDENTKKTFLLIFMENVGRPIHRKKEIPFFVPSSDKDFLQKNLMLSPKESKSAAIEFHKLGLCPEDEWYKNINFIEGKIVDFHRFSFMANRYFLPSNNKTKNDIENIFSNCVKRYQKVLDNNGLPKWKGKIYQGFIFDNGSKMDGYSSDNVMYDSYRKLPFVPLNKAKNGNVLDIGSNQGFFSFQAAMHGAKKVIGVEITKEDVLTANDIKGIVEMSNVEFINTDAVEYVKNTQEQFSLVFANSVIHQIYPNFKNSDSFLEKISKITNYFAIETPMNHPLMNIKMEEVVKILRKYFKTVRILNVYDAYSSGYRANIVCYS